jgi:Asp/Glu/hydantoin racemase
MRILVVNVNTTESITQAIARSAQAVAAPGTEIVGLTPSSVPTPWKATSKVIWRPSP